MDPRGIYKGLSGSVLVVHTKEDETHAEGYGSNVGGRYYSSYITTCLDNCWH